MNPAPMGRIEQAISLALWAHANQTNMQGEAYILHPLRVAAIVRDAGGDEDEQCAAILHDTVEDTTITLLVIKALFGDRVAVMVDALTRRMTANFNILEARDGQRGWEEPYQDFISRVIGSGPAACRIKRADVLDNLGNMGAVRAIDSAKADRLTAKYTRALDRLPL